MAWGMTIDKSQGLTLKQVVIDLEGRRNEPSLAFVALSRTGSLQTVIIDQRPGTFTHNLLTKCRKSKNFQKRLQSDQKLIELEKITLQKYDTVLKDSKFDD